MRSKNSRPLTHAEGQHLADVKLLACSVCGAPGPSDAHHIEQGNHFATVALCKDCHQGSHNGIHGRRAIWNVMHMTEIGALGVTIRRLREGV